MRKNSVIIETAREVRETVNEDSICMRAEFSVFRDKPLRLMHFFNTAGANGAWGYNQPDMIPSQKSCAVLDMNLETKMADENCSTSYDYLCQMSALYYQTH